MKRDNRRRTRQRSLCFGRGDDGNEGREEDEEEEEEGDAVE